LYAQTGRLVILEKNNLIVNDIIKPRSFRSDNGTLKPISFLGIVLLYGKIASLTTIKIIPYLTPLFAAIGLFYFYALVKRLFEKNNALISVLLLSFFPIYTYYSARSMFHNILFIVLLLVGIYYLVSMNDKKMEIKKGEEIWHFCTQANWQSIIYSALAGLAIGLAISVRSSELLWVAPMLVVLYLFNIRKIGVIKIIIFLVFFVLALLPTFYYNQLLFGSFYLGGYAKMNNSIINIKDACSNVIQFNFSQDLFHKFADNIMVFGLHPRQSLLMFKYYFIEMFSWLFWPAMLGALIFCLDWRQYKYRFWVYSICLALTAAILILYYGSWIFYDNPNRANHTIGNSYTRYWLPIYLGIIPFASWLLLRIIKIINKLIKKITSSREEVKKFISWHFSSKLISASICLVALTIVFYWSINFVLTGSEEGLIYLARNQQDAKAEWQKVLQLTENNSVIITTYHDKLFFPERKVIIGQFNDQNLNMEYAKLANILPVYYYNFNLQPQDLEYLNNSPLANVNLQIKEIKRMTDKFTLYQLYLIKDEIKNKEKQKI
ncbi:MAG: glycosyltransferase family 39 protein, partial [Candidatus Falkowbacteria bacterium]|nr:glycosyltransferase family 39 protein [Candidatus Falkowbacteria bacterium]